MIELYPYASEDRLCKPHSYMYTSFVGEKFFSAYATIRAQAFDLFTASCKNAPLVTISKNIQDQLIIAQELLLNHKWHIEKTDFLNLITPATEHVASINTPDIAMHFCLPPVLETLLNGYTGDNKNIAIFIEYLAERFELGKCLRLEYNNENGILGEKLLDPLYYAQFSLLLGSHCLMNVDYKLLNTLLKLMDTLCSIYKRIEKNSKTAPYAAAAIILERAIVLKALQENK